MSKSSKIANNSTIGIQGGRGSFNEIAILRYLEKSKLSNCEIKYLYTSDAVLSALSSGQVDYGQFALRNSVGGVVQESVESMSQFTFKIIEQYAIHIEFSVMKRKEVDFSNIHTIMGHPQSFKQCKTKLSKLYSHLKLSSGDGEDIDPAKIAEMLQKGSLPANIAVLGPEILAQYYDLEILRKKMQDQEHNMTTFLLAAN